MQFTEEWQFHLDDIIKFNDIIAKDRPYVEFLKQFSPNQQGEIFEKHVAEIMVYCIKVLSEENSKVRKPSTTINLIHSPIFINEIVKFINGFDEVPENSILLDGINRGLLLSYHMNKIYG